MPSEKTFLEYLLQIKENFSLRTRWRRFRQLSKRIGTRSAFEYGCHESRQSGEFRIHAPGVKHPLTLRGGTSDLQVFYQIFVQNEHRALLTMPDVRLVMDCGAYVGCSAVYFLNHFPRCRVIAVEPNPENFALLKRNLAPYADRVTLVHAGLWSETTSLVMSRETYRDGLHWSGQVRPCQPGETGDFQGVDIGSLLKDSGHDRISILKMDIEGAEAVVFSRGDVSWLDRTDALTIELHDDTVFGPASEIFHQAIRRQNFDVAVRGELTVCRRPRLL